MKRIIKFNEHQGIKWVEKSDPMISRGSVSIYELSSYGSFVSFVMENKDIFRQVQWSINPLVSGEFAESYFDAYLFRYPNFYVLIDYDKEKIYGISVGTSKVYCVDITDRHFPLSEEGRNQWERTSSQEVFDYLNKLRLKLEDLK